MKKNLLLLFAAASAIANANAQMVGESESQSWALLPATDGLTWSLATDAEYINLGNEYYDDLRFETESVKVYNAAHQEMGGFTIDVKGTKANDVVFFGPITQHLFNADDQWEVCVQIHVPGSAENQYRGRNFVRAYSLDGQMVFEGEGQAMIAEDGSKSCLILSYTEGEGMLGQSVLDVYRCEADGFQKVHTFSYTNSLIEYCCSSILTPVRLSDGLHFITGHYDKSMPLLDEYGEQQYDPITWLPKWTPDNFYIIENYNANFELVDEVWVPTDIPAGMMARLFGIGSMSDKDITEGYFTADSRYNYIVMNEDTNEMWSTEYTFDVYAQGGELVGTLFAHCGDYWNRLSSIEGEADQWIFLGSDPETYEQQLTLVDASTLQVVDVLPSQVDGKLISANFDRMADPVEGYKYVVALNEPSSDEENNVISHYGIYHKDFTVDRYVNFNMGPDAETFDALVNNETLDPTLFCGDDLHEFLFLTKKRSTDGKLYNTLYVGNEEGEILRSWSGDGTTNGDIQRIAILNYGTDSPELFISYSASDNSSYYNEFIPLPLVTVTGLQQVGVHDPSVVYNLQGQLLARPANGLNVRNGKVVFTK